MTMFKGRNLLLTGLLLIMGLLLVSCGERISFQKSSNKYTISYPDLEKYYLENVPKVKEPVMPQDQAAYKQLKDIAYLQDAEAIRASLNAMEIDIESNVSANYQNRVSLLMLIGQYRDVLLSDKQKALSSYQKIWQEYQAVPFLHPYFDPKKKELTNEWYLLFSDAEAIMKAGAIYEQQEKPDLAIKCYKRILRYYANERTGSYSLDFPDRYGRVVAGKLIKLIPIVMPEVEPVRSYSGDRRQEFAKMAATFPYDLTKGDTKKWVGYISYGGVIIGYDRFENKWTEHDAVVYQLQHKMGPQYDMSFGWIKSLKAQSSEITVKVDRDGSQYLAVLAHPKMGSKLHLSFRPIDSIWYLTGMKLY